jgi:Leucine-rich repeat (LRR) protein
VVINKYTSQRVDEISFPVSFSKGTLPASFQNLANLNEVNMRNNSLTGMIPGEIFSTWSKLQALDLDRNQFSGPISTSLGYMTELVDLYLAHNRFNSGIPSEIGYLSLLNIADLSNNSLVGTIPDEIGYLSSLWALHLNNNLLTGTIPATLAFMTSLETLSLRWNYLTGAVPESVCDVGAELWVDCASLQCNCCTCEP